METRKPLTPVATEIIKIIGEYPGLGAHAVKGAVLLTDFEVSSDDVGYILAFLVARGDVIAEAPGRGRGRGSTTYRMSS